VSVPTKRKLNKKKRKETNKLEQQEKVVEEKVENITVFQVRKEEQVEICR